MGLVIMRYLWLQEVGGTLFWRCQRMGQQQEDQLMMSDQVSEPETG